MAGQMFFASTLSREPNLTTIKECHIGVRFGFRNFRPVAFPADGLTAHELWWPVSIHNPRIRSSMYQVGKRRERSKQELEAINGAVFLCVLPTAPSSRRPHR